MSSSVGISSLLPGVISTCLCVGISAAIFGMVATDVGMWDSCCSLTECGGKKNCDCTEDWLLPENATCKSCLDEYDIGKEMISDLPFCSSMFALQVLLLFWQMKMLLSRSSVMAHIAMRGIVIISVIFQALEIHYVATPKSLTCAGGTAFHAKIDSSTTTFWVLILGAPMLIAILSTMLLVPANPLDSEIDLQNYKPKNQVADVRVRVPGMSSLSNTLNFLPIVTKIAGSKSGSETSVNSKVAVGETATHVITLAACAGLVASLEQLSLRELYWQIPQIMNIINSRGRPIPYLSETKKTAIKVMAEAAVNLRLQELVPVVGLLSIAASIGSILSQSNFFGVLKVQPILIAIPSQGNLPDVSHPYSFTSVSDAILSGGEPGAPAGYAFAFDPDMPITTTSKKSRKDKKSKKEKKSKKDRKAPSVSNAFEDDGTQNVRKVKRKRKKDKY